MTYTKRQHYVPQFYLKNFADSNGNLYVYDKQKVKAFKCYAKDICKENDLYETKWENANEKLGKYVFQNDIEVFLAKKEYEYAQLISRILKLCTAHQYKNALICNSKEKRLLAEFVTNLFVRNPWTIKNFQCDQISDELNENKNIIADRVIFWLLGYGSADSLLKAAQKKVFIIDGFSAELTKNLCAVNFSFFYSPDSAFVSSNFPSLMLLDSSAFGSNKCSAFLPLSPNVAVIFGNFLELHSFRNRMIYKKKDIVMKYNQKYINDTQNQVRYIICQNEALLQELINQKSEENI